MDYRADQLRNASKSAITGKFVKSSTVKKSPSTTYTQTVKKSGKKG